MHVRLKRYMTRPAELELVGRELDLREVRCAYISPYTRKKVDAAVMPLTPMALHVLKETHPKTVVHPEVAQWYSAEMKLRDRLRREVEHSMNYPIDPRLHRFQRQGVSFIVGTSAWGYGPRAMLADDPRLGKTVQSLVAADFRRATLGPVLIVTMKALMDHWYREVQDWTAFEPIMIGGNAGQRTRTLSVIKDKRYAAIVNWETLRIAKVRPSQFKMLICDEAHVVRNRKAQVTKGFMKLRPQGAVLASATFLEHGPEDYFPLVRVLRPWEFRSYWQWVGWFCETQFNGFGQDIIGTQNEDVLEDLLTPMAIGREAEKVSRVPRKVFKTLHVRIPPALADLYARLEDEILVEIAQDNVLPIPNKLARMVRLRQVSSAPRLLGADIDSPKIGAVADYIESLPGSWQALIYTSFRGTARITAETLRERGISTALFLGGDDPPTEFKQKKVRCCVATPEVGGVGQDFSNAKVMIYIDLPLSATTLRQSLERTTAMKMREPRLIVFVSSTPIDYDVAAALQEKQKKIKAVDIYDFIMRRRAH
jgi:SNF2 family DNA or RNA helicase